MNKVILTDIFEAARREIRSQNESLSIQLGSQQFLDSHNLEKIRLLFMLSREAILDPQSEKRFIERVAISENRELRVEDLKQQLARVEDFFKVPAFSLKSGRGKGKPGVDTQGAARTITAFLPAPRLAQRIKANIIDFGVIILFSVVSACLLVYSAHEGNNMPRLDQLNVFGKYFDVFDLIAVLDFFVKAFFLSLVFYPLIALLTFRKTLGMHYSGLTLCPCPAQAPKPYQLRPAQAIIRSLSFPLASLLGGFLPALFKRRGLHDVLAKSQLGQSPNP